MARTRWALLAALAMTATGQAATVRTTNFVVEAARQDDAEEFARLAEIYRKEKALDWLGREMPPWRETSSSSRCSTPAAASSSRPCSGSRSTPATS